MNNNDFEKQCQNMVDNIAKELQKRYDGYDDEIEGTSEPFPNAVFTRF